MPSQLISGRAVTVEVPASSANLGPGFDSIGLALGIWDRLEVRVEGSGLHIECTGEGSHEVPLDENHLIHRAMVALWDHLGAQAPSGLILRSSNSIPHSRGMGSSASAIVAGVGAAAALAGVDLTSTDGLALVNDVSSTLEGHPDNASASVYGGLTLSWADDDRLGGWRTVALPPHPDVVPVVLVPDGRLATHLARAALPATVPLRDAAAGAGRAALLVHALTADPSLLHAGTRDWLHQEARRPAYPASMAVVDQLRGAGLAATVSGAGPSVLTLVVRAQVEHVSRLIGATSGWQVLTPGVPEHGLRVVSTEGPRAV